MENTDGLFEQGGKGCCLGLKSGVAWSVASVAAFHLAYRFALCDCLMFVFLFGLLQLGRVRSNRIAMYLGIAIGLGIYGPHLAFFWRIFGPGAMALWVVLAFWVGLFLLLLRQAYLRVGWRGAAVLAPFLWMGIEYFRGELYYLRFSWLTPGMAFSGADGLWAVGQTGVYGMGFALMALASLITLLPKRSWVVVIALVTGALTWGFHFANRPLLNRDTPTDAIAVAGVQLEFPVPAEAEAALDRVLRQAPKAELIVLSEYTFDEPIPDRIKAWCRKHGKYLLAGGKDVVSQERWFNTVFVVDPKGEVVFQQAKSVPIQFFKDGTPAITQRPWNSPWGKLGIAICYDLSYTRVMDRLATQGAQGLIIPTMDVEGWGEYQHRLHARVAPIRAAEYGVPIFRVASSGISQLVERDGAGIASGGIPGQGEIIAGTLRLARGPRLPWDRWMAPLAVGVAGGWAASFALLGFQRRRTAFLKKAGSGEKIGEGFPEKS